VLLGVGVLFSFFISISFAADWVQLRGPNQDGSSPESVLKTWPTNGLPLIWKVPMTNGFSSLVVNNGRVISQVRRRVGGVNMEVCVALNLTNGIELWASPLRTAAYDGGTGNDAEDGPRSTPTVRAGQAFVLDSYLGLHCLNVTNGATNWSRDLLSEYGGDLIGWQSAASPVCDDDLIFVNVNCASDSLVALRAADGGPSWRSQNEAMTHASPVVATIAGVRQVVFLTQSGLVSLDRQTGSNLWRYSFPYSTSSAASPLVHSNIVFCSAAYGSGAAAVRVSLNNGVWNVTQLWRGTSYQSHWMSPVCSQGFLYGMFGSSATAPLKCIELATGRQLWSVDGFGRGGTILADGHLLVLTEAGKLVLARAVTNAYTEMARFQAVTNTCWNIPVLSGGRLYARGTKQAASFDISLPPPPPLRWLGPQIAGGTQLLLQAANTNGTPIDSNRLARIRVRATTDLTLSPATWPAVTNLLVLSNGVLRLEHLDPRASPRRYFMLEEQP
jgi:outer membrane protein assembly factor BamB